MTVVILCLLPIVRRFFLLPLNTRFFDLNSVMTSLGQIAGLSGMTLFSLNLILASRLKFLDGFFYGLNRVYTYHRAVGAIAFSLLLFHPLFLVFKYLGLSLRSAALFLLPFTGNPAVTYGIIALLSLIILIVITFYAKIKYNYWKISHKFMTLVFIFALLHVIFISSDISRDLILRAYIIVLGLVGLAVASNRAWLYNIFHNDFIYKIINLNWFNKNVVEIELEPINRTMPFQSGQFAFLRFKGASLSAESHPFSMSAAPSGRNLKFVIKSLGDYTDRLASLRAGDSGLIHGPFGKFSFKNISGRKQIWLAGGIGITPFLSMAGDLADDYKVDLYYCTKDRAEAVLIEELEKTAAANSNFRLIPWFSAERGRISGEKIAELSQGLNDKEILLCGPLVFMKSLREQLMKLGVAKDKIHWEKFDLI